MLFPNPPFSRFLPLAAHALYSLKLDEIPAFFSLRRLVLDPPPLITFFFSRFTV